MKMYEYYIKTKNYKILHLFAHDMIHFFKNLMIFSSFKAISAGQAVKRAPLAGNVDDPEGSLDALMQVYQVLYRTLQ